MLLKEETSCSCKWRSLLSEATVKIVLFLNMFHLGLSCYPVQLTTCQAHGAFGIKRQKSKTLQPSNSALYSFRAEKWLIYMTSTLSTSLEEPFLFLPHLSAVHAVIYPRMPMQAQMLLETE